MTSKKCHSLTVIDRLTQDANSRIEKWFKENEKVMEKESKEHTFKPCLVSNSSAIGMDFSNISQDFMERQQEFL